VDRPAKQAAKPLIERYLGVIVAGAGALAALGLPPLGWWPLGLAGVALLLIALGHPSRQSFGIGWGFGFLWFGLGLDWLPKAFSFQSAMPPWMGHVAHAGLAAFLALYVGAATWAARRLATGPLGLVLALAGTLTLTDMLRGHLFTGFSWNPPGLLLLGIPGVRDAAATIGADGLTTLLLLAAGALALAAQKHWRDAAIAALLAALLAAPGLPRLALEPPAPSPALLLLVQPNSSQAEKHGENGAERHLLAHVGTTGRALAALTPEESARLAAVVWPEGSLEFPPDENPWVRSLVTRALPRQAHLLAGGISVVRDEAGNATAIRNSLFALSANGSITARYDKAHLVPGGEYLPLRRIAEPLGLSRLVPGSLDFLPGPGPANLIIPGLPPMGAAICYEIIFPARVVSRADRPGLILTVSSDAWFGRNGPPQHFALARLRAIEEGLPIVRVTPTGITGLIDARGRVVEKLAANTPGTLLVATPQPLPPTPFARLGQLIPAGIAILLLAAAVALRHLKKA
jgi:apolipoprotein N-acyltransferase